VAPLAHPACDDAKPWAEACPVNSLTATPTVEPQATRGAAAFAPMAAGLLAELDSEPLQEGEA
jgi:hypothetical protein